MNDNEDASRMMDHLLFGIDRRVGSVLIYAIEGPEITLSAPESGEFPRDSALLNLRLGFPSVRCFQV